MRNARLRLLIATSAIALAAVPVARPSEQVAVNATGISLAVNGKGEALVTYTVGGTKKHLLVWGALNAKPPSKGGQQVAFKLDYSGGYGKYDEEKYWKSFGSACQTYKGPALAWLVKVCKAPDGSYWALQQWQRELKNYGVPSSGANAAKELRVSHWTGGLPVLAITTDRSNQGLDHLFGTFEYSGKGVYGFASTSAGVPKDSFGRNVYVDTFDSAYGSGWKRENSFLTHAANGSFCYLFAKHGEHPTGDGEKYRATVIGPGVTPDAMWSAKPAGTSAKAQSEADAAIKALNDPACKPV